MRLPLYMALLTAATIVFSVSAAEKVKVNCLEFEAITGDNLPCDSFKQISVDKQEYEKALSIKEVENCKSRVRAKFTKKECQVTPKLYNEPKDYQCHTQLKACEPQKTVEKKADDEDKVELW
ncbi:hypothetical protein HMF8227_02326 [Saliniradius amylolyticus]|uniref:Uncharacterized protein n=1 Tax=Saliniradius amylolyticus TaxID=2183582 RepID=A0A2S2E545_9ALTE|nr:hypothetical protein [Saliniradius amylolyticus]AWL12778.1 hypothetical protein HMF8227_02326 [Saliniradius amylolyticus]